MSLSPDWTKPEIAPRPHAAANIDLAKFVPGDVLPLKNPQTDIPRIARDPRLTGLIDSAVQKIPTFHALNLGDARAMSELAAASVHLVLTSPPYWTLKEYRDSKRYMNEEALRSVRGHRRWWSPES